MTHISLRCLFSSSPSPCVYWSSRAAGAGKGDVWESGESECGGTEGDSEALLLRGLGERVVRGFTSALSPTSYIEP